MSPGRVLVSQFENRTVVVSEKNRLKEYVQGVLTRFKDDERVLMWDIYNEPNVFGDGDGSSVLLKLTWEWAQEVRPSQPLTSCLEGSKGKGNLVLNADQSDIIIFHTYRGEDLEPTIIRRQESAMGRPIICTEYMARELGTTFHNSLPIFKKHQVGCYNWGLVAGKSQTHWNWASTKKLEELRNKGAVLKSGDPIPEPALWFHDIFRIDGSPFDQKEVDFIKDITGAE